MPSIPPPPAGRQFSTTHWSVVLLAGQTQSPQSAEALERLCRTYWPPLYTFIRRRGYGEEDAQDLTQQFFAILLARKDFGTIDPCKGKFRTFLLTSLTHFLANERDRSRAAKRGGGQEIISLEALESERGYLPDARVQDTPDKLFDFRWAATVLEAALRALETEMVTQGKSGAFEQLKTFLTEEPGEGDYDAAAEQLAMTRQGVAVTVHRLRQRYRELVRAEVAQTVASPLEVDEEMRHLYLALTQE